MQNTMKDAVDSAKRRAASAPAAPRVEDTDCNAVNLEASSEFWKLIEARRREPTLSI